MPARARSPASSAARVASGSTSPTGIVLCLSSRSRGVHQYTAAATANSSSVATMPFQCSTVGTWDMHFDSAAELRTVVSTLSRLRPSGSSPAASRQPSGSPGVSLGFGARTVSSMLMLDTVTTVINSTKRGPVSAMPRRLGLSGTKPATLTGAFPAFTNRCRRPTGCPRRPCQRCRKQRPPSDPPSPGGPPPRPPARSPRPC